MRRILSVFVLMVMAIAMHAQVTFNVSYKRVSPTEVDIIFTGKAAPGWHIYSTNIPADGPNPATFNIDSKKGAKAAGKLKGGPGAKTVSEPMFDGMKITFYENKATFTQRVTLTDKDYEMKGYFQFSACNDENCMPPTNVDFKLKGSDGPDAAQAAAAGVEGEEEEPEAAAAEAGAAADSAAVAAPAMDDAEVKALWTPVIDELNQMGNDNDIAGKSWWYIFFLGFLGGLIALVTPCVWPIIPMTVSFFLKRADKAGDRKQGVKDAITYGISIIVIYMALGLIITTIFGASALNDLSTNAIFNILFFLMLVVFAASFFGGFEITLPSKWSNAVDSKAGSTTGMLSIFLMAFTLTLVSFSCTGPIIGFLLVEVSTSGGSALAPTIGMFGFALALAIPFTLFALFPSLLNSAKSSGSSWLNKVKVVLGFLELAFALKFFSVADLAYGWHLCDREVFLSLWIIIFTCMGLYLLGFIKFPHDDPEEKGCSVTGFFIALCSLAFAVYMIPGLWGAPVKAVSAFAPPMSTQDFNLDNVKVEAKFNDYEQGMAYAKANGKPVMVDFTGFGCVNCRKMELAVWHDAKVRDLLTKDYVLISLYVDDKTKLAEPIEVQENGKAVTLRTVGDRWSYLQRSKFGCNAQPYYFLLDNEGHLLGKARSYDEDIDAYVDWLHEGLDKYAAK